MASLLAPLLRSHAHIAKLSSRTFSTSQTPATVLGLYKYLLRQTEKLPEQHRAFYKDSIKRVSDASCYRHKGIS